MNRRKKKPALVERFGSIYQVIFTFSSLLVLGAVAVVVLVSLWYTRDSLFDNSVTYTKQLVNQVNSDIDSYIEYMKNISDMIFSNEDVDSFLQEETEASEEDQRILGLFATIHSSRQDITNIGIIDDRDLRHVLINDGTDVLNPYVEVRELDWYREAVEQPGRTIISKPHVQNGIQGNYKWVITMSRCILDHSGRPAGVLFIDLNYSAISQLCENNSIGRQGYIFILDSAGQIVYHPQQQLLYGGLKSEHIEEVMEAEEDTLQLGEGASRQLYTISKSQDTGWKVVGTIRTAELLRGSQEAQQVYVLLALLMTAVIVIVSSVISRSITKPIKELRDSMQKVQEGNFNVEVEAVSHNEIGSLGRSFNIMTEKIKELVIQNISEQKEKRRLEMKALQSQINPHFLYNTLDSIIWMAQGKKTEDVVTMTSSLARLLRQSLSSEEDVSLEQEIKYVESYLVIQKMRYQDKLEFSLDMEESVGHARIPKLVLQPLVENAIYHGLKYKEGKGKLFVQAYEQGNNVAIEIADNGVGMNDEALAHIFDKHKVNYQSNGIGVYNVQRRLKLAFGSAYGLTYDSVEGEGTIVTVLIPSGRKEARHE
jgi:two-component system sensor histidine kinase YesM